MTWILSILTSRLAGPIGAAVSVGLAIALGLTAWSLSSTKHALAREVAWGDDVYAAVKTGSANPKLARRDTAAQVAAMGRAIDKLRSGLNSCNSSAKAAADHDAQLQKDFAARIAALDAARQSQLSLIARLRTSAAHPAPAGTCEPSPVLSEIWT
jgi:hypothetical protein